MMDFIFIFILLRLSADDLDGAVSIKGNDSETIPISPCLP